MSHYANYVRERLNKQCYETPEGFAVYWYTDDAVYIEDIYVEIGFRKSGAASRMADYIADEARCIGITKMLGSVNTQANGATISTQVLLGYGMMVSHISGDLIIFTKDI
jgi:hypothetical protein